MKKLLLLAGAMGIASMSYAQDEFVCDEPAIDAHYVYDDFSGPEPFLWRAQDDDDFERRYGTGFYEWQDTSYTVLTLGSTPERNEEGTFSYSLDRNTEEGYLEATVTQPIGAFEPFGISFGDRANIEYPDNGNGEENGNGEDNGNGATARFYHDDNGNGNGGQEGEDPFTLDFTPSSQLLAIVSNMNDYPVEIRISLQDIYGHTADTKPTVDEDNLANAWEHTIAEVIPANQEEFEIFFEYDGAVQMEWYDHPDRPDYGPGELHDVDLSQISSINFTLVNTVPKYGEGNMENDPEWFHAGLEDATILIHSIQVGDCRITPVRKAAAKQPLKVFPNPASSQALVSYESVKSGNVEVRVSNLMGVEVASFNGGRSETEIPVSNLSKGVYLVTVLGDGVPVGASRLVVE
ncbi:T9SS type A sorting domain-containing protein [Cytophagaceae bacterium ABcell3]|nr:T9SS type A sorting domain-containing protein [Cytophagaceae bacterium ABcell3]